VPDFLKGATYIRTAGNDKMYEDDELCFSFVCERDVTVYVMHGNTFETRPAWLNVFTDTGVDIFRPIEDDPRNMSFSVFAKKYPAGKVEVYGDLPKGFLTPPFRNSGGAGYCMYSIIVQ